MPTRLCLDQRNNGRGLPAAHETRRGGLVVLCGVQCPVRKMPGGSEDRQSSRGPEAARRERRRYRYKTFGRRLLILILAETGFTFSAFLISRCEYITVEWTSWNTFLMWLGAAVTFTSIITCAETLKTCICDDSNLSGFNSCSRLLTTLIILGFFCIQTFIFVWRFRYGCPSSSNVSLGRLARSAANEDWTATYKLQLVPYEAWSNQPAATLPRLQHPAPFAVLDHSAGQPCAGPDECLPLLRGHGQPISHNFLIDSAGYIYVGRGADVVSAIQGAMQNCSLDVALLGDYNKHNVTEDTVVALQRLLAVGVSLGWLAADYHLVGHSQLDGADLHGPGHWALALVQHWPHHCVGTCFEGPTCPGA